MPVNVHPEYVKAEKEYLEANSLEEKLKALEKMISLAPGHKGAENLRAQLRLRYKKLKEKIEKAKQLKKTSRGGKEGIKKEEMQAVIVGFANSGKSSLLKVLTNASPEITDYEFTTKQPVIGMVPYSGTNIQLIENPAIESEYYDRGLTNNTDTVILLVTSIPEIEKIEQIFNETHKIEGKKIIAFNKTDLLSENEKRKISSTLASKYSKTADFVLISVKTLEGIEDFKDKLFKSFGKIRVYLKEPSKTTEEAKKNKPLILEPGSTVRDVAEKILKGFSEKIKQTKIWGPSSKFPGQVVGLQHELKDLDIVEFKTK